MDNPNVSSVIKRVFKRYYKELWDLIVPSIVWLGLFITIILSGPAMVGLYYFIESDYKKRKIDLIFKGTFEDFGFGIKLGLIHILLIFLMIISFVFIRSGDTKFLSSVIFFTSLYLWLFFSFIGFYIIPLRFEKKLEFREALSVSFFLSFKYFKYTLGLFVQLICLIFLSVLSVVGFFIFFPSLSLMLMSEGFYELMEIEEAKMNVYRDGK